MKSDRKNPQFIRTDKAITSAFMQLLHSRPFEKITVQDILDETPVTRATFYAHFKDKYDIAERMQAEFIQLQNELILRLSNEKRTNYPVVIQQALNANRELVESLLKIHTDTVDLQGCLAAELEQKYLTQSTSPNRTTEAKVYAQAMTAFQLACMHEKGTQQFTTDFINKVMTEVMMYILQINNDETRRYLYAAIRKAENSSAEKDIS